MNKHASSRVELSLRSLTLLALSSPCAAQDGDFIHYKFDSGCTAEVINYATGAFAWGKSGILDSTSTTTPWTSGAYGEGLAGGSVVAPAYYNRVRTGWDPSQVPSSPSMTIAWFTRLRSAHGTAESPFVGNAGGFQVFAGGSAGRGLYARATLAKGGNGATANDFLLPAANADLQTLAALGWVHVALVVDAISQSADWYVNGTPALHLGGTAVVADIKSAGEVILGQSPTSNSCYDIDEFLISRRAFSAAEIRQLAISARAGAGPYASGIASQCGSAQIGSYGGRPTLGNAGFVLTLTPPVNGSYLVMLGTNRCTTTNGLVPLPLDLAVLGVFAAGCQLLTDPLLTASGPSPSGTLFLPLAIPNASTLMGLSLYAQGALYETVSGKLRASRGWALSLGS